MMSPFPYLELIAACSLALYCGDKDEIDGLKVTAVLLNRNDQKLELEYRLEWTMESVIPWKLKQLEPVYIIFYDEKVIVLSRDTKEVIGLSPEFLRRKKQSSKRTIITRPPPGACSVAIRLGNTELITARVLLTK